MPNFLSPFEPTLIGLYAQAVFQASENRSQLLDLEFLKRAMTFKY
jgi:hypothetical protein